MGFWDDIDNNLFHEDFDFIRENYSGVERLDELLDLVLSFKEGHEVGVTAFGEVAPADGTLEEGVAGEE